MSTPLPPQKAMLTAARLERRRRMAGDSPTFEASAAAAFPALSPAQRAVCRLVDGLPPVGAAQEAVYRTLLGREWADDLREPRERVVLVFGRGSGKSMITALWARHRARTCATSGILPGERIYVPVVAPRIDAARQVLEYVKGWDEGSGAVARAGTDRITYRRRTAIALYAADSGGLSVRSKSLAGLVLDEAGFFRTASGAAVTDRSVVEAATYRLRPGARVFLITTPWTRSGLWWETYREDWGKSEKALVLNADSRVLNPAWVASQDARPGSKAWQREVEAHPVEDEDLGLCSEAQVRACTREGPPAAPRPGVTYRDALDLAGGGSSRTAYAVGHLEADRRVCDLLLSWPRAVPVERRVADVVDAHLRYGVRGKIACDQFSYEAAGALVRRAASERGADVDLELVGGNRAAQAEAAGELLRAGLASLPDDPRLGWQLPAIAVRSAHGGGLTLHVPRDPEGGHCDEAIAVILLMTALGRGGPTAPIVAPGGRQGDGWTSGVGPRYGPEA